MKKILLAASFLNLSMLAFAQPAPTISGDNMLCPEGTGTVTTQQYDSYQWYMRYFMSEDTLMIDGANSQTLTMDAYTYSASYLIVEVTENGQTAMSPEFFVDGYAFAGITAMTEGDFTQGEDGEFIICEGDTLWFTLMMPYDTNITWFHEGGEISGEEGTTLVVTEAGGYTVSGAPAVCPDFVQNLGTTMEVITTDCGLGIGEEELSVSLYPNPANDQLTIAFEGEADYTIISLSGSELLSGKASGQPIDISSLSAGAYLIKIKAGEKLATRSLIVE
jgi:hypothetical protein